MKELITIEKYTIYTTDRYYLLVNSEQEEIALFHTFDDAVEFTESLSLKEKVLGIADKMARDRNYSMGTAIEDLRYLADPDFKKSHQTGDSQGGITATQQNELAAAPGHVKHNLCDMQIVDWYDPTSTHGTFHRSRACDVPREGWLSLVIPVQENGKYIVDGENLLRSSMCVVNNSHGVFQCSGILDPNQIELCGKEPIDNVSITSAPLQYKSNEPLMLVHR